MLVGIRCRPTTHIPWTSVAVRLIHSDVAHELGRIQQLRTEMEHEITVLKNHNRRFNRVLGKLDEVVGDVPVEDKEVTGEVTAFSSFPLKAIESDAPVAIVSRFTDPFINLALEDYIYQQMPKTSKRVLFYINNPCVVIGKNQNPWKELNMPMLTNMGVPLVRRNSGGGTVVHDNGNMNFSFMTSKEEFDRFYFAELVANAVNRLHSGVKVNDRGDIVTNDDLKVSGSAYKIAKGKSYHHGTMLLNSRLDVLKKLLTRPASLGVVETQSIDSVKSPVTNTEIDSEQFIDEVIIEFERNFGHPPAVSGEMQDAIDQNEMMGLGDFFAANNNECEVITLEKSTELPETVWEGVAKLKTKEWRLGHTPKFTHKLTNADLGLAVTFHVHKGAIVEQVDIEGPQEPFEFLIQEISKGTMMYEGSRVAGFITDDAISDWIGSTIDGTT